eukprot:TRINITY_DN1110_c0_g1_i1.p1 TRINITY_DN1110_c0_g1~~TRINITY_DN1110_c0_g1_i1.p1  ORF type:complete len:991 (-),score=157.05 TRINITY_DN1110_c0_g1_i1:104-3076(-)
MVLEFFKTLFGGFQILLWVAALLCFISYGLSPQLALENLYIGGVLVFVVVITGIFTFVQEASSKKAMAGFIKLVPQMCTVIRDGDMITTGVETLVLGDVVVIKGGDRIPADLRLVQVDGLKVDNSSLTGESEPQNRSVENTHQNPLETKNIAFFSTSAVEGTAKGVVINCGDNTVIGRIAGLVAITKVEQTPINKEINHFIKIISGVAVGFGVIFLIIGLVKYGVTSLESVTKTIVFAIGIIVANVPEGLLATVTVALTLTAKRMASKNVLVKKLEAVETLGSTTAICTDKTGTLTQNVMTVTHLWYDNTLHTASHEEEYDSYPKTFKELHNVAILCNRTVFDPSDADSPVSSRKCIGDASETALLRFCHMLRDSNEHRLCNQKVAEIPFNSTNKYALTICEKEDQSGYTLYVKGAPDRVVKFCSKVITEEGDVELDKKWNKRIDNMCVELGSLGERVLGFCKLDLPKKKYPIGFKFDTDNVNFPVKGLTFVGLISLMDPPRDGVAEAVTKCQSAHIKVIMVTGDHPVTAKSIAKQVGIIREDDVDEIINEDHKPITKSKENNTKAVVISGGALKNMDEQQLQDVIRDYDEIVFARTSPQQKLIIVEACQKNGHIVAVTGDGVNDSPALKKANIGIAMGKAGSEVAKEAATMLLLDDNFASIIKGIEEGRILFDNLKKSIAYTLSSNIPELLPFLLYVLIDIPLPLSTVLILCIDLGTDMWPAISLAYENAESDIMRRKPRNLKTDNLVTSKLIAFSYLCIGVIQALASLYVYIVFMSYGNNNWNGFPPESLPGIGSSFINLPLEELSICRVNIIPGQQSVIGCARTVDELNNITNPILFSGGNWTGGITNGNFVDYCYNAEHRSLHESCGMSDVMTREELLRTAQSAYFICIVMTQWFDVVICKTRRNSIFQQGMKNFWLNSGILFETALTCLLIYTPFLNPVLGTAPVSWMGWILPLPFCILIIVYDEVRRYFIRKYPHGWVHRHTYY